MQYNPGSRFGAYHITEGYMDRNTEGQMAVLDTVSKKAAQIESLFALLAHTAGDEELMPTYRENACWLGQELAVSIRAGAVRIR